MIQVLVIDDDPTITTLYQNILPPQGFDVLVANSGPEGVQAARKLQPDVIVLDLIMPGMTGWEVCREIRTFSQTPILVLSAVVDAGEETRALDAGADDYLVKPIPRGILAARLRRLAQQAQS